MTDEVRTIEDVKLGLECGECSGCPYDRNNYPDGMPRCKEVEYDAIALIEHLESQIPKWISVGERLPEVSDVVLVIANGKPSPRITLDNACLIASYWGDEGWIADGFCGWDALQVTYWMPLPEPPKEGNNGN